ncbi:MAG: FkbM family methyltransferase [Candidatus Marinimicrobia bacterium]|nr:FkbM family methyltransferase [Candidatus Neomarinimicrobiota bacterium]
MTKNTYRELVERKRNQKKKEREFITVDVVPLLFLLEKHNIKKIDFLSIDVEGAEKAVLDGIDLQHTDVQLIAIENNYKDIDLYKKIIRQGYKLSAVLGCDEIFEKV